MDPLFAFLLPQQKPVREFCDDNYPSECQNLGVITEKVDKEEVFVCFNSEGKQKFFLARSHQIPIIKKICESPNKDILYEEITECGFVQARGFKFNLPSSDGLDHSETGSQNGTPVIGYVNNRDRKIYAIPMILYGSSGNGMVSRFEKTGERGEYFLYDKEGKLINEWPLSSS